MGKPGAFGTQSKAPAVVHGQTTGFTRHRYGMRLKRPSTGQPPTVDTTGNYGLAAEISATSAPGGLIRDGALAGISSLAVSASTFLFYSASVRSLGVESGGALLANIATTLMLSVPATVGGLALGTTAAKLRKAGARRDLANLTGFAVAVCGIVAVFALCCAALAGSQIGEAFAVDRSTVMLAALLLAVMIPLLALRGLVQGVGGFVVFAGSNVAETLGRVVLSIILLLHQSRLRVALGGLALSLIVATIVVLVGLIRSTGISVGRLAEGRTALRRALPILLTMGSLTTLTFFDAVAARHWLSARDSGLYNAAALAGRALMTVLAFTPALIMPKIALTDAKSQERKLIVKQSLLFGTAVCVISAGVFAVFPSFVIDVVAGHKFIGAAPLVGIYGVAASALAMATIVSSLGAGHDGSRTPYYVVLAAAVEVLAIMRFHSTAFQLAEAVTLGHCLALAAAVIGGRADARPDAIPLVNRPGEGVS
jgi:O-antigen/teichoic acid export membrane protein